MRLPILVLAILALTAPKAAWAGVVSTSGAVVTYAETVPGETNNLTITAVAANGGNFTFTDSGSPVVAAPGSGCGTTGVNTVSCTSPIAMVNLGGGNDTANASGVTYAGRPVIFNGGAGADILTGGVGDDVLNGDDGADQLNGGNGDDQLFGNTKTGGTSDGATDRLRPGAGQNYLDCIPGGGPVADGGIDRAIFDESSRTVGVAVDITANPGRCTSQTPNPAIGGVGIGYDFTTGTANDIFFGTATVSGIESFTGSPGADFALLPDFSNTFSAGAGDDQLIGNGGADFFSGGLGADFFDGGVGTDRVTYSANAKYDTSRGISVTLDGSQNDGVKITAGIPSSTAGAATESDRVLPNIEYVYGGTGPDRIDMSGYNGAVPPAGVSAFGAAGNDYLIGSKGSDYLDGGADTDTINCGADTLTDIFLGGETLISCP